MMFFRRFLTWLLAKLGWLGEGLLTPQYTRPDPGAAEFQPRVNPAHPLFTAEVERLDVKRCIGGEYQWFTVIALGLDDKRLGGVKLQWELENVGIGTVLDMPNYVGQTRRSDGSSRFFHTQMPCRYRLIVEGTWLVENVSTALPWKCYYNGFCTYADPGTFVNPGRGGWLSVTGPGKFGYICHLQLKS